MWQFGLNVGDAMGNETSVAFAFTGSWSLVCDT